MSETGDNLGQNGTPESNVNGSYETCGDLDRNVVPENIANDTYTQGYPSFEPTVHRFLNAGVIDGRSINADEIKGGIAGCSQDKAEELKAWLDGISARVNYSDDVDDLILAKKELEEIQAKVVDQLNGVEVLSWLVP